jgi:hypothetical protein
MKTKFLLCIATLSFSVGARAYDGKPVPKVDTENSHNYWGAAGAYYMLNMTNLNSQLKTWGFNTGFGNAMAVGIDRGGEATSDEFKFPFVTYLSYHYLLPQEISSVGDSLKMKLNGYNCQFDFLALNYLNSETASFTAGIAWAFGRLKATENVPGGTTTFINSYFAPQIRTELNFRLGDHFYVGARASYRFDVTKTAWTKSGINSPDLAPTSLSGAMFGAFIGFGK